MCDIRKCKRCKNGIWDNNDPGWIACIAGLEIIKVKEDEDACYWFEDEDDDIYEWNPDNPYNSI